MSNPTPLTPEQKEAYWLGRIVKKANSFFPPFVAQLEEIIGMANHGLTDENKRKLRILIANDLGRPLTKLEIKDEVPPQHPVPPTTKPSRKRSAASASTEDQGDKEHLRSSILPDAGSTDDTRPVDPNPSDQSGS